jgi:threonine aldolase
MVGGGMRQAGILAAAGLFALEHNAKGLAEDHANARRFAEGVAKLPRVTLPAAPETNIVVFERADAPQLSATLRAKGVWINALGPGALRAVTHLDVSRADVDQALAVLREVCG